MLQRRELRRPRPVADKNGAQWKINPYDRWVEADHQSSPACPICHSKVGCGCRQVAAPTQNWTQNDGDKINALPRSNPYPAVSGPSANYPGPSANYSGPSANYTGPAANPDYDRVLRNAQAPGGPGGPYGALAPPKLMSSGIGGPRGTPYSANYAPSSQLGVGNSYNNMDSSTAQFVLESTMDRARF